MRIGAALLLLAGVGLALPAVGQLADARQVPFEELFTGPDTIRLDPSILVGRIWSVDVNQRGELLVGDLQSRAIYLFAASGEHLRSFSVSECLPDASDFLPISSRFAGADHFMTYEPRGPAVVFGVDGSCVGTSRRLPGPVVGFCAYEDSVIALRHFRDPSGPAVVVYSTALQLLDETPVTAPEFPVLNGPRTSKHAVACFDAEKHYVYDGQMDSMPVRPGPGTTQVRPPFFVKRRRDIKTDAEMIQRARQKRAYPSTVGVLALDGSTRMVVFSNLRREWQPEGSKSSVVGLSIASNDGQFPARSTLSPRWPRAAGSGYFYAVGDLDSLPDGDLGNPVILRYRFVPPPGTKE